MAKCIKCNIRESLLAPNKIKKSKRYDWTDESNNKRMNVLFPTMKINHCYICSKENLFKPKVSLARVR